MDLGPSSAMKGSLSLFDRPNADAIRNVALSRERGTPATTNLRWT